MVQQLNSIFNADFNLNSLTCVRKSYNADTRYNRMEIPRRMNGLMLLQDGSAVFQFPDGTNLHGKQGDVIFLPKGAKYLLTFSPLHNRLTHPIILNFLVSEPDGTEIIPNCGVLRLCRDDGTLQPLFVCAAQHYEKGANAKLKASSYELFGEVFPVSETDECCISYISRNYTQNFNIPQLAARCAMSETAYRKKFRQLTGFSPVQYINHLKIERACQMLLSDDISPQDISDFLGFYKLPYFYKVFKDITGMTPNQYRDTQSTDSVNKN